MSEPTFVQPTEMVAESEQHNTEAPEVDLQQYPADHPLVRTLAAQKAQLKELKDAGEFKELNRFRQFKELQAKAARLDELEEANKSDAEKIADRIAKAEAEVTAIPAKVSEVLKAHLIDLHGFDQEDADLFLTATDPDLLRKQADRLVGPGKRKNIVPREGRNPNPAPTDPTRDFLRSINGQ